MSSKKRDPAALERERLKRARVGKVRELRAMLGAMDNELMSDGEVLAEEDRIRAHVEARRVALEVVEPQWRDAATSSDPAKQWRHARHWQSGSGYERWNALVHLESLMTERAEIDEQAAASVESARAAGASWAEVGAQCGLSAEGAKYRWGRRRRP